MGKGLSEKYRGGCKKQKIRGGTKKEAREIRIRRTKSGIKREVKMVGGKGGK